VGNLSAVRDFLDVRDVVKAYDIALDKGEPGEVYNISSGTGVAIKEMLDTLISLSTVNVKTEVDEARLRPSDVELLVGSSEKFQKQTGWKPEIPFKTTLRDLLDYWRDRIK
jgi:GDP-4-dehydro-6-deoxy-D-mannose reductase